MVSRHPRQRSQQGWTVRAAAASQNPAANFVSARGVDKLQELEACPRRIPTRAKLVCCQPAPAYPVEKAGTAQEPARRLRRKDKRCFVGPVRGRGADRGHMGMVVRGVHQLL